MPYNSHDANYSSIAIIRIMDNAAESPSPYHTNMARKTSLPKQSAQPDWYLPEWMKTLKISQAKLAKDCDWKHSAQAATMPPPEKPPPARRRRGK